MQPTRVHVPAFTVAGPQVRTRNSDEMNPATARIGALWGQFMSECPPVPGRRIFGVYSAYESDEHGAFDVTASTLWQPADALPAADSVCVQVSEGDYLVFTGHGEMPQTVWETWGQVWRYFADNPQVQRRFDTDFESYDGPEQVAIHIGVKP